MRNGLILAGSLAAAVLAVDQLTKTWAERALDDGPLVLFGPVRFELVFNSGVAFGVFAGVAPLLVAAALLVIIVVLVRQRALLTRVSYLAIGLVAGGALGNIIDRLFRGRNGAVVDFISIWRWPVFNLADTAVVIGALLLAFAGARRDKEAVTPQ